MEGGEHPRLVLSGPQDLASCSQNWTRKAEDLTGPLLATCEGRGLVTGQAAQIAPYKTEVWAQLPPL